MFAVVMAGFRWSMSQILLQVCCYIYIYILLYVFSLNLLFNIGNLTTQFTLLIPCSHVKAKVKKTEVTLARRLL
jgi:hypothetical protein